MRKFLPAFLFVLFISLVGLGQNSRLITGSIVDSNGNALQDVYVKLTTEHDSLTTTTNEAGTFRFSKVTFSTFTISATMVGYEPYSQLYTLTKTDGNLFKLNPVKLKLQDNRLTDVVVVSVNPIKVKEDTVEYKASAYKVREGAPVEEVLKKLPGVTVDKDGHVTAQGKQISRIRVNGKDYFGGDVQTATQNLPADILENIQIIDDYGDRANITGIKEGEPEKILNINVQKGKNKGSFGNATAGAGNEGRFIGQVAANNFNDDRQLSLLGSINNTNANTFNFSGGGRGGGARGTNMGAAERGGNADGITLSKSFGVNFRNKWGNKLTTYGSYSFSSRNNTVTGTSFQQDFNPRNINSTKRNSISYTNSYNHRVTWNVEYNIDSFNYIKVTPYYSYASSTHGNTGISELMKPRYYTLNNSSSVSTSTSPAGGSDFLYNHKFRKRGRNFSLSSTVNFSSRDQDRNTTNNFRDVDSTFATPRVTDSTRLQDIVNESRNFTTNIRVSYAEPISKFTSVEASYTWNNSNTESLKTVDDVEPLGGIKTRNIRQSNDFQYSFTTNRYGISLRTFKPKYNYSVGVVAQPSILVGKDLGRKANTSNYNFNIIPSARFVYNFARSNNLTITLGGASREPGFTQLQPIADSSNIRNVIIGNADLKAELTNRLSLQYNKVNVLKGNSLFVNFSYDRTQNKIVSARFNNPNGTGRTITYMNTDGFYGFNGNFSYTQPFANRKFSVTMNSSGSFDNNISFTDDFRNNGKNWIIRPGARIRLDIDDIIDVDVNSGYSINKTVTRYIDTTIATQARSFTLGLNGKNYFFKNWTLGYDLTKVVNKGYYNTKNANPTLLNMYVERRFLKNNRGTIRAQAFDIFNQNTGISRTVNGTTVTDIQNDRLARYFLLTFNLRLQKFAGRVSQRSGERRMESGRSERWGGSGRNW